MSKRGLIAKIADYPNELLQPEPVKIAKGLPLTINASIGRGMREEHVAAESAASRELRSQRLLNYGTHLGLSANLDDEGR